MGLAAGGETENDRILGIMAEGADPNNLKVLAILCFAVSCIVPIIKNHCHDDEEDDDENNDIDEEIGKWERKMRISDPVSDDPPNVEALATSSVTKISAPCS
ncbi:hypothetical protein IV203_008394 [Nitzschia inconspicua]|uniref:Uncharacterized protein n=1 Tax=Nitzschia inconspicua TaxID=303405 RepID=A0A9K3PMN0_9STRA|nr:hypothetical protein IV203_008394 [Nitzschia inconspicua]